MYCRRFRHSSAWRDGTDGLTLIALTRPPVLDTHRLDDPG
jgi:hypothetical protein